MHEEASYGTVLGEESILFQVEEWASEKILMRMSLARLIRDGKYGWNKLNRLRMTNAHLSVWISFLIAKIGSYTFF